jgi:hypothetical protein
LDYVSANVLRCRVCWFSVPEFGDGRACAGGDTPRREVVGWLVGVRVRSVRRVKIGDGGGVVCVCM